ncbi:hypothetical protein RHSIM_Rhsim04G0136100 [Rhododendron simsii]|uniref:Ribonuclease H1 N-terminal domain-containing protein n=1 Tax=Rhododendron simsii TaxID=118357 RepID=A0A834HCU5_RHOSS|nr:hypothetical protein RHSIM_Rhsim04G0136100 [Rhododendron simsii]
MGRNPGIYDSWAACSDQVNRFSGAVHNKFASWDEAYNAWLAYTCQVEQMVPPPILPSLEDAAGPSSEYTPPGRDSFPLWLILSMTFCVIVVVATNLNSNSNAVGGGGNPNPENLNPNVAGGGNSDPNNAGGDNGGNSNPEELNEMGQD